MNPRFHFSGLEIQNIDIDIAYMKRFHTKDGGFRIALR